MCAEGIWEEKALGIGPDAHALAVLPLTAHTIWQTSLKSLDPGFSPLTTIVTSKGGPLFVKNSVK